jgi:hypothetical protein
MPGTSSGISCLNSAMAAQFAGVLMGGDGVHCDIQLKGSGPTPFSRRGDG